MATNETGIASIGMIVARKPCKKRNTTIITRANDLEQGMFDFANILVHILGRVIDDLVVESLGEALLSLSISSRT